MVSNLRTSKILWGITLVLALLAAGIGVLSPRIYDGVFAPQFIPGAFPADVVTVLLSVFTLVLITRAGPQSVRAQAVIVGVIGSLFYNYGIFTMERAYNFLYLVYAAIFAMSFWSILYTLMHRSEEGLSRVSLPAGVARLSAIGGLLIALLFTFLWTAALVPLMQKHDRIEWLYSVYVLDLCFVMPAFFITSVLTLRKDSLGIVMLPAVYIVGIFVIFPLGLAEVAKPFYGQAADYGSMLVSFVFSAAMLVVAIVHLRNMKT